MTDKKLEEAIELKNKISNIKDVISYVTIGKNTITNFGVRDSYKNFFDIEDRELNEEIYQLVLKYLAKYEIEFANL